MKTRTFGQNPRFHLGLPLNLFLVCVAVLLATVTVTSCAKSPNAPGGGGGTGGGSLYQLAPAPGTSIYQIPVPGSSEMMRLAITRYSPTDKDAVVSVGDEVWAEFEAVGPRQRVYLSLQWREEGEVRDCFYQGGYSPYDINNDNPSGYRREGRRIREETKGLVGLTILVIFKDQLPPPGYCADYMAEEPFNYRTPAGTS